MVAGARSSAWWAVLRSALVFTPVLTVALVALWYIAQEIADKGSSGGRVVALVLIGFVALLLAYQVVQSLRDLFSRTVETVGVVDRCWTKNDFFLFRNSYIFVGRDVYRLSPEHGVTVDAGDSVRIVHYPHTGTVETIEVVARAGEEAGRADG